MGSIPNKVSDFNRRTFTKDHVPERVELVTSIDGRQFTYQQSTRAEMMLFVSRPSEDGFEIEIVERGEAPYTETTGPGDEHSTPHQWQKDAMTDVTGPVHRRSYVVEGEALDQARRIEVVVRIDGNTWLSMEAREPGLVGYVARKGGFDLHVVGAKAGRYRDHSGPDTTTHPLYGWQIDALGLGR